MAYKKTVFRSEFFGDLSEEKQKEFFKVKDNKFLPTIDNIYYSVFLEDDRNENEQLKPFFDELDWLKQGAAMTHTPYEYDFGLQLDLKSFSLYKYCLTEPDLYDIFIINFLPNEDTPRIVVQIRAYGLWIHGAEKMLTDSYNHVEKVFSEYGLKIIKCRENRLDYCYHTNAIVNPEKMLSDKKLSSHMSTNMRKWCQMGNIEQTEDGLILHKDYFSLGNRKSNNVFIRIYNKGLEVIEQQYKSFFFELWYKNGLISFYDKYCLEYAYLHKNYDYVHKAKLLFCLEYGVNEVKKAEFTRLLNNAKSTLDNFKSAARGYMPEITTIMNIEFETKRRFYYFSDKFINVFKTLERPEIPQPIKRLFQIIDNRSVFLDYLTTKSVCFNKADGSYASWWNRLRNTKLDGLKSDEKLLREYSQHLDEQLAKVRFINSVSTNAVYNDNVDTGFLSDVSDLISNLNDNDIHKMKVSFYNDAGVAVDNINSELLAFYHLNKARKEQRLKNRKKKAESKENLSNCLDL